MERIDCEGAPRDLGLAQGVAFRRAIRARVERSGISTRHRPLALFQPLSSGPVLGRGPGREIVRHYPHLAERVAGIARGAGLPLDALVALLVRDPRIAPDPARGAPSLVAGARRADRTSLALRLPPGARRLPWILRRSRPEVGFASAELTLPWLAGGVAGVNTEGLAAAIAPSPAAGARGVGATALLLVQECLQRFGEVDAGLDWCLKRPGSGDAWVALADASGALAAVEISGATRRVLRATDGAIVQGERADLAAELHKQLLEGDADDAAAALARADGDSLVVRLSPAETRLGLVGPDGRMSGAELAAA